MDTSKAVYVIEFRNGNYFQSLEDENSGPLSTAQTFASKDEAKTLMRQNEWILFNGGCVVTCEYVLKRV